MQWVVDVQRSDAGWFVRILNLATRAVANDPATGEPLLTQPRELGIVQSPAGRFPLPPAGERPQTGDDLARLCDGSAPDLTATLFRDVISQSISLERMKTFGRYLFLTLIGQTLWQRLVAVSGADNGVELILSWRTDQAELTRLPWEMMHGSTDFLAVERRFSVAREIAGATGALRQMSSPPRVLFVIGSGGGDRHFDGLRPGAEYFGLLRGLRQNGIGLNITPLIGATSSRLEVAVQRFRPDVVHFICHGHEDGTIDLVDDDNPEQRKRTDALAVYELLHPTTDDPYPGPQIVVLNACHSASGGIAMEDSGQAHFPLAAALVAKGVPVVVGMAGEVADLACRLFSRGFYQSLLTDGRVLCAAAKGRRAGLIHGSNDRERIDWALPTVFISESAAGARISVAPDPHGPSWHQLAEALAPPPFPGYYARLDLLRAFGLLMSDEAEQRKIENRRADLQVLGLSTAACEGGRLGRTWALSDLAATAARNGDVPILVDKRLNGRWPVNIEQLLSFIMKAARATLENLGLATEGPAFNWRVTRLLQGTAPGTRPPSEAPPEIANIFSGGDPSEYFDMLAAAVRWDMLTYLEEICSLRQRPQAKLLLLIDDLHKMGDAVPFVLGSLLGTEGLRSRSARRSVRVLFTYAQQIVPGDQTAAVAAITDFLSQKNYATDHVLAGFRDPTESQLAYENFLFNWRRDNTAMSLVPMRANGPMVEYLFRSFREQVRGIPSQLAEKTTDKLVEFFLGLPAPSAAVRVAGDEDAWRDTV